ncbi:mCG53839, partial [Mus musculus]
QVISFMSAVAAQEPGLPDQEGGGGGMGDDPRQIVLHVLPIEEAAADIDGTAAFLVSQAVVRAIAEEEGGQEELLPDVEEIWPPVEEVWPDIEDIWPAIEAVWPDVEEDWYIWNDGRENDEDQRQVGDQQDYNKEGEEENDDDDDDDDEEDDDDYEYEEDDDDYEYEEDDDDYEYEEDEDDNEGEDNEDQGEIILRAY